MNSDVVYMGPCFTCGHTFTQHISGMGIDRCRKRRCGCPRYVEDTKLNMHNTQSAGRGR